MPALVPLLLLLLLSACATAPAVVAEAPAERDGAVHEKVLANGLKVIVKTDRRAPVVVSQIWYKVGSSYEHDGITGISHVLEHMMFKGTKRHPAGEFSRIIADNGGRENAFTGRDYTAYFQTLAKDRLAVSFELEADRMRGLLLDPQEFAKEVQVVMEERRMRTEDNPSALTGEQFQAVAYLTSPYHWPIIGWMDDLEHLTVDDLRRWYDRWYRPNNATVVVVGDVDPETVFALAERYYGPVEAALVTPPKPRREVRQRGERRIEVRAPARVPQLMIGWKVPSLGRHDAPWEPYAMEVLAAVLDGGLSARLETELVRRQRLAASIGTGYDLYTPRQELLTISATPAPGRTVAELEAAILEQIERLKHEPVAAHELARVKAQVVAGKVYERDSMFYQAMQIGMMETLGYGWPVLDEYLARIEAVTPEQIRQVARKYLVETGRTVAVLVPEPPHPQGDADRAR